MRWSLPISRPMEATLWQESTISRTKKPTLLAEGFVAGHGGARNATTLYKGGEVLEVSWLSGTGRGVAVLSRIEKVPQAATKVQEEEVQVPGSDLNALFGKSDEEKFGSQEFWLANFWQHTIRGK